MAEIAAANMESNVKTEGPPDTNAYGTPGSQSRFPPGQPLPGDEAKIREARALLEAEEKQVPFSIVPIRDEAYEEHVTHSLLRRDEAYKEHVTHSLLRVLGRILAARMATQRQSKFTGLKQGLRLQVLFCCFIYYFYPARSIKACVCCSSFLDPYGRKESAGAKGEGRVGNPGQ